MSYPILRWAATGLATVAAVLLAGCEKPPMDSTQTAFRGLAMGAVTNPRITGPVDAAQVLPAAIPAMATPPGTPTAGASFKNVKVLADVPVTEFTRTMLAITAWVSPKEGCAYCHKEGEDLAADTLYTKVVARKMLEMNRTINAKWNNHTLQTGVTCYTCHRGQAVPPSVWFDQPPPKTALGNTGQSAGHNRPSPMTGLTAIDNNVLVRYLLGNEPLRNAGVQALPVKGTMGQTIVNTENTFGFMIHVSNALGVNCTHCHNTRSHADWSESPPTRAQAYHGILMSRELNNQFMVPLTASFPATRLGPKGDVAKISCATCHQGVNKPLKGAPMLKDFPALGTVKATGDAAAVVVPAEATTSVALTTPAASAAAKVLFATGKDTLDPAAMKAVVDAATAWRSAGSAGKLAVSGYADKAGNADANLELAKKRAFAVRDALKRAGVPEDKIELKKPEFAVDGASADARRVEIVAVK
jgi:photosynthetic reaction center cytochrome c subunit